MYNLMVDLETLSTSPNAYIVSIGAAYFYDHGIGETFYKVVMPDNYYNLHIDPATVAWWMQQSDRARSVFASTEAAPLETVLYEFRQFVKPQTLVWGNGANFDNVILANAYRTIGHEPPWPFYMDRCFRTLKECNPQIPKPVFAGTAHNALDDAINQANHATQILWS